ncbi:MAG: hypothetical protein ACYTFG_13405, partial [Planctomycetota bacterium]
YGLDPKRAGATGGSAGAGISLWLAFHEDLADAENEDPVARQSTRLTAAVVYGGQSTYDPREHKRMFDTDQVHPALPPFFGMKGPEEVDDPKFHPLFREASALTHLTKDDVPVLLFYPQANTPLPKNASGGKYIHHPKFGEVLKERMDALGVKCVLKYREDYEQKTLRTAPTADYVKFFCEHLLEKEPKRAALEDWK